MALLADGIAAVPVSQTRAMASALSRAIRLVVDVVATTPDVPGHDRHHYLGGCAGIFVALNSHAETLRAVTVASGNIVRNILPCAWVCISKLLLATPTLSATRVALDLDTAIGKVADAIASAPDQYKEVDAKSYASYGRCIADEVTRGIAFSEELQMSANLYSIDLWGAPVRREGSAVVH